MTAAIFGLVGVAVGGIVTGGVNYFLESRRERKELRRATRLVAIEIDTIRVHFKILVSKEKVPLNVSDPPEVFLPSSEWERYKPILAAELAEKAWFHVSSLYDLIVPVRLRMLGQPGAELSEQELSSLNEMVDHAAAAQTTLGHAPSE